MRITEKDFTRTIHSDVVKFLRRARVNDVEIDKSEICKTITKLLMTNEYHPRLPEFIIDHSKGDGVSRPVPVMNPSDTFVYYYCVKKLENEIAINRVNGTFGGWRMGGNKIKQKENAEEMESDESPGSGLNPSIYARQYGEFNSKIRKTINSIDKNYKAVEIDIANFYDCIRLDQLEKKIRAAAPRNKLALVDLLFYFLTNSNRFLHSYRPQSTGLPQDLVGEQSRLLANFYLQDYDKKISNFSKRHSIKYLRFADDQIFFIPKGYAAEKIVNQASKYLYHIGLNINAKKVRIWTLNNLTEFRCISTYELLNLKKPNKEQTRKDVVKFTQEVIVLINKHNDKRSKFSIKNGGLPLIKKVINLGLENLPKKEKAEILSIINRDVNYLKSLKSYNIFRLYNSLNQREKAHLLIYMDQTCKDETHSAFTYELMLFRKQSNLTWKRYAQRLKKHSSEWAAL